MVDYYKNLTKKDIDDVLDLDKSFSVWNTYYDAEGCDLYFVGIKKPEALPEYTGRFIVNTT